jgi:hypothetical protein
MYKEKDVNCHICKNKFKSLKALSSHIRVHDITKENYYKRYLKVEEEGICYCGLNTNFISLTSGYHKYCSTKCQSNDLKIINKRKVSGDDHWTRRIGGPNKGKTYEEIHGIKKAKKLKKQLSLIFSEKYKGKENPFFGKTHSSQNRKKFYENRIGKSYEQLYGFERAQKIKEKQKGKRKNEYSDCKYPYNFYNLNLRKSILSDQKNKCAVCGCRLETYRKNLHHINYVKKDNRRRNLIYLCVSCHVTTNGNRDFWKGVLRKTNRIIIKEKTLPKEILALEIKNILENKIKYGGINK